MLSEYFEVNRAVENGQPRQAIRDTDATGERWGRDAGRERDDVSTKLGATLRRPFIEFMMPLHGSTVNEFVYSFRGFNVGKTSGLQSENAFFPSSLYTIFQNAFARKYQLARRGPS
jgi:hypothetical protein